MNILAIDTSGPVCGVAVTADDSVLSEMTVFNKRTHSANLMPMVESCLQQAGLDFSAMDRIACVVGPGSFTGVRIGVATVKGLAMANSIPCVPVDALEALALSAGDFDGVISPLQDARCGQVYTAAFCRMKRLTPDRAVPLEKWTEELLSLGDSFLFCGDGMSVYRERLTALLGDKACFALPHLAYLRPSAAAVMALHASDLTDVQHLEALYLRAPNAQLNRKLLEAMKHE